MLAKLSGITVVALCSYESFAMTTGMVPTITKLSESHRWISPVLVGALSAHLYYYDRTKK